MKKVIYTVITNGYDRLLNQPRAEGWDYICFSDNEEIKSNFWEIRRIPECLNYLSSVKKNRCIKILPHKYLSEYDFSIYIDGNVSITGDVQAFVEKNCKESEGYMFAGKHPYGRKCIYDEEVVLIKLKKDKKEIMDSQIEGYRKEGFPENLGMTQNSILFRYHNNPECIRLMDCWWSEVEHKSHRDQLSLFYAKWKTNTKINYLPESIFKGNCFKWNISHNKPPITLK